MRRPMVAATLALIATFAAVAVPGSIGSGGPSPDLEIDARHIQGVDVASLSGTTTTTYALDPAFRSNGRLGTDSVLLDPDQRSVPSGRPSTSTDQPVAAPEVVVVPAWRHDANVSWYGPGFYGKRTACGLEMSTTLQGVAHRSLPCGTMVSFRNPDNGRTITVAVVDRGPYVGGRQWDLTAGACTALGHCYTGSVDWKLA